jgi:hypothetical protein
VLLKVIFLELCYISVHNEIIYKILSHVCMYARTYSYNCQACSQNYEKQPLVSSCLSLVSVLPHGTTLLQLDGF